MNELYSNEINEHVYRISVKGVAKEPVDLPVAKIVTSDDTLFESTPVLLNVIEEDNEYRVAIPSQLLHLKRFAKITFEYELEDFGDQKQEDIFEITRRIFSFDEALHFIGQDRTNDKYVLSYQDYDVLESGIRLIIETYCNQKFNLWHGAKEIYGSVNSLHLNQHMEKIDSVVSGVQDQLTFYDTYEVGDYSLSTGGTLLGIKKEYVLPTFLYRNTPRNSWFVVTGLWGYLSVPRPVKEAALELLKVYDSSDIQSRRQYLLNKSSGEDSFGYNFAAYRDSTGNPIADALLSDYRIFNLGAV